MNASVASMTLNIFLMIDLENAAERHERLR